MLAKILQWFVSHPSVYDLVQRVAGGRNAGQRLAVLLTSADGKIVLDMGGGTGRLLQLLPSTSRYLCLDNDPLKLRHLRQKYPDSSAVLGDATALPLADGAVDVIVCRGVAHHLAPETLDLAFREAARVCHTFVFQDPILLPDRLISRLLWRYDRGRFPRSSSELQMALSQWFELQKVDKFTIYHQYMLCSAEPKREKS